MEAVLIALFGSVSAYFAYKAKTSSQSVDKKTATNGGLEPWQYLEMIQDVREAQLEARDRELDVKKALAEHTEQDAENFAELADLIRGVRA